MRKNREFIEGAFYHVTSRTNDKIRVIDNLCRIVTAILRIGEAEKAVEQTVYLHYYTDTAVACTKDIKDGKL